MNDIIKIAAIFLTFFIVIGINAQNSLFDNKEEINKLIYKADSLSKAKFRAEANQYYRQAITFFEKQEQWKKIIPLVIKISNNLNREQEYDKSMLLLEKYSNLASANLGKRDSLTALILHKTGGVHFLKKNRRKSINYYKSALNIRHKIFDEKHADIGKGLHNIGLSFQYLMESDSAIYYFKKSIESHPSKPYPFISRTFRELQRTFVDLGDFQTAEDYLKLTLEFYDRQYQKQQWKLADFYNSDICSFYLQTAQFEKALSSSQKAINIYESIEDKYPEDYIGLSNAYMNKGLAYKNLGNFDKALQQFEKSYQIGQKHWKPHSSNLAYFESNIANIYKRKKEYKKAIASFQKALKSFQDLNFTAKIADTYNNLGDVFFDQKQYHKALKSYHLSLPYLLANFQKKNEYVNPILQDHYISDKQALLIFLEAKAKTFKHLYDQNQQQKDLQAAHETYNLLDELIDDIRLSYLEDASKSYLVKQTKPIYEKAIGVCLQYQQLTKDKKYVEQAFNYAEKSKAIILLEQIKEAKAKSFSGISDSLQQQERQLKREIGQIEKQLALKKEEENRGSLDKSLRERLIRVKGKYEDLVNTLETNNEAYHQLKYDLHTVDILSIQQKILKDNQTLVEYFVGEDSLYFFIITKEEFKVIFKAKDFPLKEWIDSLRQGIYYCRVNKNIGERDCQALDRQYGEYAAKLYQKLIAPLSLGEKTEQLIIIPDGVLGYIPFDALLTQNIKPEQQNQFQQYPYLGLEYMISYSFSATFLNELEKGSTRVDNNQLLAFAPSFSIGEKEEDTLKVSPSLETSNSVIALRSNLSPLFFNQSEIDRIEGEFSGKSYKNKAANKNTFLQEASNYRYIHIASHGKMNDNNADLSYIAFTQDRDSTNQEELLYLRELYDMEIPADMVVLSACETGLGELQNGEGIISLARGFSYAGAKSIITSLWNVNDQKTADLMVDFYRNLKEGQTKDRALASAKRKYIQNNSPNFAHPFYWAGFIPIGNMEVIEAEQDWTWEGGLFIGIILLMGLVLYLKLRRD